MNVSGFMSGWKSILSQAWIKVVKGVMIYKFHIIFTATFARKDPGRLYQYNYYEVEEQQPLSGVDG